MQNLAMINTISPNLQQFLLWENLHYWRKSYIQKNNNIIVADYDNDVNKIHGIGIYYYLSCQAVRSHNIRKENEYLTIYHFNDLPYSRYAINADRKIN